MNLTLAEIARDIGGSLEGPESGTPGACATGYSIDTRTIGPGHIFFAIRGPRFDGHDFLGAARARGAVAAVVARNSERVEPLLRSIRVESPAAALGDLARAVRRRWGRTVIAITGSVGKTTTKEMIATVLATRYNVLRSVGNLNNELGVPLSLLAVGDEHDLAVLEMGMSAPGEISRLAGIALPNEGVVTNVHPVHLEFFDSIEGIAAAKAELVHGLVGDRRAYLNADDPRVRAMAGGFAGRVVTWGTGADAGFRIVRIGNRGLEGTSFTIAHDGREVDFTSPVPGRHNVSNAAAAIAVGVTHEVGWDQAQDAVRRFSSALRRGVVRRYEGGFVVIDDSYNSNPAALAEMIAFVASLEGFRRRILVAGEMLELGADSSGLHSECGRVAAEAAFEPIIGVSGAARELLEGARRAGAADAGLVFADTAGEAGQVLAELVRDGDVILIKGSRGVHLEEVSEVLGRSFPEAKG